MRRIAVRGGEPLGPHNQSAAVTVILRAGLWAARCLRRNFSNAFQYLSSDFCTAIRWPTKQNSKKEPQVRHEGWEDYWRPRIGTKWLSDGGADFWAPAFIKAIWSRQICRRQTTPTPRRIPHPAVSDRHAVRQWVRSAKHDPLDNLAVEPAPHEEEAYRFGWPLDS